MIAPFQGSGPWIERRFSVLHPGIQGEATSEPDFRIIPAKLGVPRARLDIVSRPRLLDRLDGAPVRVVLVSAPAPGTFPTETKEGIPQRNTSSSPLTENGFARVVSNPGYPGRRTTVADAVARLRRFASAGHHTPWPDDVSVLQGETLDPSHLAGHGEITDAYLLALAMHHQGALATFDRSVRTAAVPGFRAEHLTVLPVGR